MKKAYVKPVFLAEEFVAETSYAASGCGTRGWEPTYIEKGTQICDDGHKIGGNGAMINGYYDETNKITYWDYASWDDRPNAGDETHEATNAYMFNSDSTVCDFVWDNTANEVGVWREQQDEDGVLSWIISWIAGSDKFGPFFLGNNATIKNHHPYLGELIPS